MFVFFFFSSFFCRLFVNIPIPRPRALFSPLVTLVLAREFYFPRVTLDTCLLRKSHALFAKLKLCRLHNFRPLNVGQRQTLATKNISKWYLINVQIYRSVIQSLVRARKHPSSGVHVSKVRDFSSSHFSFFFFSFSFSFLRNEDTPVTSLSEVTRGYTKNRSVLKDG